MLGDKLTEEIYKEITAHSSLSVLTLDELIELAIECDKFWDYAGIYYIPKSKNNYDIIIDREQSVGGYNNSELVLSIINNEIDSNDNKFRKYVCQKIQEKSTSIEQERNI